MIANVYKEDTAVAIGSTWSCWQQSMIFIHINPAVTYLFRTTGQVLGVSLSGAILQAVLLRKLRERIQGPDAARVHPAVLELLLPFTHYPFSRLYMPFNTQPKLYPN